MSESFITKVGTPSRPPDSDKWSRFIAFWIFEFEMEAVDTSSIGLQWLTEEKFTQLKTTTNRLKIKIAIFWDIAPCSLYMNRSFGGTYHLHLQGRKSAKQETSDSRSLYNCYPDPQLILPSQLLWLVSCSADIRTCRCRWYFPPKRLFIYRLHGAISHKMVIFITAAVRTSNLTDGKYFENSSEIS
jgi:hypothetical protein